MIVWKIWTLKPLIVKPGQEPLEFNILGDGSLVKRVSHECERIWSKLVKCIKIHTVNFLPQLRNTPRHHVKAHNFGQEKLVVLIHNEKGKSKEIKERYPFFFSGNLWWPFHCCKIEPRLSKDSKIYILDFFAPTQLLHIVNVAEKPPIYST